MLQRPTRRVSCWLQIVLGMSALGLAGVCGGLAMITLWPKAADKNIDWLRDVIGDVPVAQLEPTTLRIQGYVQPLQFQLGHRQATVPRALATEQPTPNSTALSFGSPPPNTTTSPMPLSTSILPAWQLSPLTPLGKLVGEGLWSPYLQTADGQTTVAYRTFLQPDPRRPYSLPAIVAFDLQATRLHFVLGTVEPMPTSPQPSRTGTISAADLQPGVLIATFNGGFKAQPQQFGAMADGLVALPPIDGLATVAMFADGRVQIGEWGTDIKDSPELVAWRQNGKALIHQGQINPETARTTVYWGLTLKGETFTWRSALGLSADARTLYYVAGSQLDVATLAKVMAQTGATEALQLDVNNFWVHFAAIRSNGSNLIAEPLLKFMTEADRYLKGSSRDFFYVTTAIHQ